MRETWYVLEDGGLADPADVTMGDDGRLVHASGVAVEMRGDVPRSRGVDDADAERAKAADALQAAADAKAAAAADAKAKAAAEPKGKDVKPEEPRAGYKTRDAKAG